MMTLFRIETFKLFKRMKTWVVLIAFILLTVVIAYSSYRNVENYKRFNTPEARIADMERVIENLKENKNNIPEDIKNDKDKIEEYKTKMDMSIQNAQTQIAALKADKDNSVDWKASLKQQIKNDEDRLSQIKADVQGTSSYEINGLDSQISLNKYLLEHDIKPVAEGSEFKAFNCIFSLIEALGELFLAIGVAVFVADMVSGEAAPPTMKLLLTQPVSRAKVIFSKFMSINTAAIACIIGVELLAFLIIGLLFGFGDASYPTLVGARYKFDTTQMMQGGQYPLAVVAGSRYIIPAWQYLVRLLLMQSLYIAACVSAVFLISSLVKNSMVSMGISVVSVIGAFILFLGMSAFRGLARYVFVLFGRAGEVITGQVALSMNDPHITAGGIVVVFVIWIVVSYLIAHIVFTKKDILI